MHISIISDNASDVLPTFLYILGVNGHRYRSISGRGGRGRLPSRRVMSLEQLAVQQDTRVAAGVALFQMPNEVLQLHGQDRVGRDDHNLHTAALAANSRRTRPSTAATIVAGVILHQRRYVQRQHAGFECANSQTRRRGSIRRLLGLSHCSIFSVAARGDGDVYREGGQGKNGFVIR